MPNTSDLQHLVLFGRVTTRILPTHNSLHKNASGPGHPLYLLWSKKTTKGCRCYPSRSIYRSEIDSLIVPSAHFPACPFRRRAFRKPVLSPAEGLHFGKSASVRGLGHNFKDSDFHSTCPLVSEKIREVNKRYFGSVQAFPISIFKVKSALNLTSKE